MENGTYKAHPVAGQAASIEEAKSGSLMLYVKFEVENGPTLRSSHCLVNKEGVVMTNNLASLKKWSGWDGLDPYWFMENELSGIEVELVVENKPGYNDATKMFPEIKWVNAPGSGGGLPLPEPADKKLVLAKFGAKFRALAGGAPAARKPPAPAAKPPPPAKPAAPAAKVATQTEAWDLLNKVAAGEKSDAIEAAWYKYVDATGMDQAEMTPEGWAQVVKAIQADADAGKLLPF